MPLNSDFAKFTQRREKEKDKQDIMKKNGTGRICLCPLIIYNNIRNLLPTKI